MKGIGRGLICLLAAGLFATCAVSGYRVWEILRERQAAGAAYGDLASFMQAADGGAGAEAGDSAQSGHSGGGAASGSGSADAPIAFLEVDFAGLRSINEQVVGWIYDEASVINYPIVQARDNDYYLYRLFNGESNPGGHILRCRRFHIEGAAQGNGRFHAPAYHHIHLISQQPRHCHGNADCHYDHQNQRGQKAAYLTSHPVPVPFPGFSAPSAIPHGGFSAPSTILRGATAPSTILRRASFRLPH